MIAVRYSIICAALLCLCGCRSHKSAAASERTVNMLMTDTTKTEAHTHESAGVDDASEYASRASEDSLHIEFAEGGGGVRIDADGALFFYGVQNLWLHNSEYSSLYNTLLSSRRDFTGSCTTWNGISEERNEHETDESREEVIAPKWYDSFLARLGLGVIIAGLLWLLFLYLKRKF